MFEDLDRDIGQYHWVLSTWLTTPDLSLNEATLVRALQTALNNSLQEFDQMRRLAVQPAFLNTLRSAAAKAMAAGLLTEWDQYAEAT